ncbi:MAG TPA: hypothetical protein PKA88_04430 [Polyangiaceae bacterium]|nr:hypothetical protein [Polyangiaceae bacterium]
MTEAQKPNSHAPLVVALLALASAVSAYASGWGLTAWAFSSGGPANFRARILGAALLALVFDCFAIVLGAGALMLSVHRRSPFARLFAIVAILLALLGLVGVAVLGFSWGLLDVLPH